ncbi:hypothetical protein [Flavobacterium humidisoli]|uniref:Uncharacterized protein n=1 Tax=Flavobacterium humidisoli TaxID=2937442 RepID=A0ABY4LTA5_9FLAO|nr:hypothetical protein [Flavobacterium humidisoli]UPZ16302.1 hypothetical protein M0M44_02930 [Flavobacterium humidisoli]
MKKIILFLLLPVSIIYAQKRDIVYRIGYDSYPANGYFYGVSVLYLRDDYSYKLSVQKYNSRRMARKNVLRTFDDEYGKWKMSGDTLLLYDNDKKRQQMKFIKVNNKRIAFLIDDVERSDQYWRKIKI